MSPRKLFFTLVLVVILLSSIIGGCSPSTTTSPKPQNESKSDAVPWDQASDYVGERITVRGPVVSTKYASTSKGSPTFLNIGKPYPDPGRFTVVIWGENRENFDSPPEELYEGKTVYVYGLVTEYQGVPEIEVETPDQIEER